MYIYKDTYIHTYIHTAWERGLLHQRSQAAQHTQAAPIITCTHTHSHTHTHKHTQPGDEVYSIDGQKLHSIPTENFNPPKLHQLLHGETGTYCLIGFLGDSGEMYDMDGENMGRQLLPKSESDDGTALLVCLCVCLYACMCMSRGVCVCVCIVCVCM